MSKRTSFYLLAPFGLMALVATASGDPGAPCTDDSCIESKLAGCEVGATALTQRALGARVRYRVVDEVAAGCAIELTFVEHPSPAWQDGTIGFTIDAGAPAKPQIGEAMSACLLGRNAAWKCRGSLVGMLASEPGT